MPPTSLAPAIRYDKMAAAFGALALIVTTPSELKSALAACMAETSRPSLINIIIDPLEKRKRKKKKEGRKLEISE